MNTQQEIPNSTDNKQEPKKRHEDDYDYLVLGPYLDQLLDSRCKLSEHEDFRKNGGIRLPTASSTGTGNIIIRGKAGTGKTTLALQIAVEAARRNNGIYAAYISFEESPQQVFTKAVSFEWERYVQPLNRLLAQSGEYNSSVDDLAKDLEEALDKPMMCRATGIDFDKFVKENRGDDPITCKMDGCPFQTCCATIREISKEPQIPEYTFFPGRVLLPQLEPCVFTNTSAEAEGEKLFWKRYKQLEDLLRAAKKLRDNGIREHDALFKLLRDNGQGQSAGNTSNPSPCDNTGNPPLDNMKNKISTVQSRAWDEVTKLGDVLKGDIGEYVPSEYIREAVLGDLKHKKGDIELACAQFSISFPMHKESARNEIENLKTSVFESFVQFFQAEMGKQSILKKQAQIKDGKPVEINKDKQRKIIEKISHRVSEYIFASVGFTELDLHIGGLADNLSKDEIEQIRLMLDNIINKLKGIDEKLQERIIAIINEGCLILGRGEIGKKIEEYWNDILEIKAQEKDMQLCRKKVDSRQEQIDKLIVRAKLLQTIGCLILRGEKPNESEVSEDGRQVNKHPRESLEQKFKEQPSTEIGVALEFFTQLHNLKSQNLALVCVDCLNVLGNTGLTRDHFAALFDLFKKYQTIGIFIVEENDRGVFAGDNPIDSETIDFLADMVIELTGRQESGYFIRHFQILKSRNQKSILGQHPCRTQDRDFEHDGTADADGESQTTGVFSVFLGNNSWFITTKWEKEIKKNLKELLSYLLKDASLDKRIRENTVTQLAEKFKIEELFLNEYIQKYIQELFQRQRRAEAKTGLQVYPSLEYSVRQTDELLQTQKVKEKITTLKDKLGKIVPASLKMEQTKLDSFVTKAYALLERNKKQFDYMKEVIIQPWALWGGASPLEEESVRLDFSSLPDFNRRILGPSYKANEIVTIVGPEMSGKTYVAGSFLWKGLEEGGDVLLLRFAEKADFPINDCKMWPEQPPEKKSSVFEKLATEQIKFYDKAISYGEETRAAVIELAKYLESVKQRISFSIQAMGEPRDDLEPQPLFIELAIKTSMIQPEPFMKVVRGIYHWGKKYRRKTISRAALLQVDAIGLSYPLLYSNPTSSGLLLPSLAHLFRCWGTPFIMTGQTGDVAQAEEMVNKAKSLATQIVTCQYQDVFGDRYITVNGPGAAEWDPESSSNVTPAVFRQTKKKTAFWLDFKILDGLVGFSSGNIRRPGVMLQFFEEGEIQKKYNAHVKQLVEFAVGTMEGSERFTHEPIPHIEMNSFPPGHSRSLHNSLSLLKETPFHNTVIRTVDEFEVTKDLFVNFKFPMELRERIKKKPSLKRLLVESSVYYRNVLVCACDEETDKEITQIKEAIKVKRAQAQPALDEDAKATSSELTEFWDKIATMQDETRQLIPVFRDFQAPETLPCLLMDGVVCLQRKDGKIFNTKKTEGEFSFKKLKFVPTELEPYATSMCNLLKRASPLTGNQPIEKDNEDTGTQDTSSTQKPCLYSQLAYYAKHQPDEKKRRYIIFAWYSQIRDAIALAEKLSKEEVETVAKAINEEISKMKLLALPGGGFVGDWYLQIPRTSVSPSLGDKIKNELLRPSESFYRFCEGVGLPCWVKDIPNIKNEYTNLKTRFVDERISMKQIKYIVDKRRNDETYFYARIMDSTARYPLKTATTLKEIKDIHDKANRRSDIQGYKIIRNELFLIMEKLMHDDSKIEDMSKHIITLLTKAKNDEAMDTPIGDTDSSCGV